MTLEWKPVESSAPTVGHPVVLRARLPHGWLVASQVHGGFSVAFVPFTEPRAGEELHWSRDDDAT